MKSDTFIKVTYLQQLLTRFSSEKMLAIEIVIFIWTDGWVVGWLGGCHQCLANWFALVHILLSIYLFTGV